MALGEELDPSRTCAPGNDLELFSGPFCPLPAQFLWMEGQAGSPELFPGLSHPGYGAAGAVRAWAAAAESLKGAKHQCLAPKNPKEPFFLNNFAKPGRIPWLELL